MKRKSEKIEEVKNLLNGSEAKQQVIIFTESETPGIFEYDGKIVSKAEMDELAKGYENVIRMIHKR